LAQKFEKKIRVFQASRRSLKLLNVLIVTLYLQGREKSQREGQLSNTDDNKQLY
jgi:hypothetical protein